MSELQVWGDGIVGTTIGADVWNIRTVVATDWAGGRLLAFAIEDGHLDVWGDGYVNPESISIVGDDALITEAGGNLLRQDLNTPGRAAATVVATGLGAPHQVVRSDDGTRALIADHSGGRIVAVDLATGTVTEEATGLGQPVGLAIGVNSELYVAEQAPGQLTRIDPDGTRTVLVGGLVGPFLLAWADTARASLLVTERAPAHRVGRVDTTAAVPSVERLVGRGITQPSQAIIVGTRLVVTGQGRLLSLDATNGLHSGVTIAVGDGPLWPGSWRDVEIDTGVSGWTRADLKIAIEPPDLAAISEHPGVDADPTRPTIRVLGGATIGTTEVVVRDTLTNSVVGRADLAVDFDATSPVDGPPIWLDASTQAPSLHTLALTLGVDDAGALRPKDVAGNVIPNWRVAVVLVDTDDAKWPTAVTPTSPAPTVADAKQTWRDVLVGANSVDTYYREISNGRLGMQLVSGAVLGPVSVGGKWGDSFTMNGLNQWVAKDDVLDRVVANLQGTAGVDWTQVDAVFMIVRSPGGGNFIWPRAENKIHVERVKRPDGTEVSVKLAKLGMPHDQLTAPGLGFTNVEVTAHELGHTLSLDDLYMDATYSASMQKRALGTRELMANEAGLPHLAARHKLLLGFLDPAHVRSFAYGFVDDATFDLVPASAGLPGGGQFAAVELKIAPKCSWFFEFRQPVMGKVGDQDAIFSTGQIVGYDATTYANPPIAADKRRPIILVNDDGDGEGAVLVNGQDYDVLDADDPNNISNFRLDILSIAAGVAKVRVRVRKVQQPDPSIHDNRGQDGDYKSPDIEIRNELSDKDKAWLNKPIIGKNRIVAKVTNIGGLPAPDVVVRFSVLPFNTDDPASERWQPVGDPVKNTIADGATVEFETEWSVDQNVHQCVQARIDRYVRVPLAAADEPDVDNNKAQSNYFEIFSKPSSPATREVSFVDVFNPYDFPVDATIELAQSTGDYRSYADHRWIHLEPKQVRTVRLEVESKATTIWDAIERHYPDGLTWMRSWLVTPGHRSRSGSGVTLATRTAVHSDINVIEEGAGFLLVRVTSPAGAPAPNSGSVALRVEYEDGRTDVVTAPIEGNGFVHLRPEAMPGRGLLYYSGAPGYAPADAVGIAVRGQ